MARLFRFMRRGLHGAVLLVIATACATGPEVPLSPPVDITNLQQLTGEWKGEVTHALGTNTFWSRTDPVTIVVGPNGSFTSNVRGRQGSGVVTIKDGKFAWDGSYTRGTGTLHEQGGKPILRGDGTLVGYYGWCSFQLTRP